MVTDQLVLNPNKMRRLSPFGDRNFYLYSAQSPPLHLRALFG
jgi:hypothetical protein